MRRCPIWSISCALFVLVLLSAAPAHCCQDGTLTQRVNEASTLVQNGSPVAALLCYEATESSATLRQNDSTLVEERFWFEYHDAAQQAAALVPNKRNFYLERVVDIADSYAQWYRDLDDDSRESLEKARRNRISNVLFDMASAYEALGRKSDLLDMLEEYTEHAEFFSPRILRVWEKTLRSFPTYDRERVDWEIIADVQRDGQFSSHWKTYRDFLPGFARVRNMKRESQKAQARLRCIFDSLSA